MGTREQKKELSVFLDMGLHEERALFRREPDAEPVDHHLLHVVRNLFRMLVVAGEGMPVGDEKKTVIPLLHVDPILQSAVKVPQVKRAGGAHPAEDSFFVCHWDKVS